MGDPSCNCCKVWTHGWSIVGEDRGIDAQRAGAPPSCHDQRVMRVVGLCPLPAGVGWTTDFQEPHRAKARIHIGLLQLAGGTG